MPLKDLTTFHIGGPARAFVRVSRVEDLASLDFTRDKYFILGGGSNVLFADQGFPGTVYKIELKGISLQGSTLVVGAGEEWDTLVERAIKEKLWGLENLSGIPGTVGGAVAGSIGAYGQSLSQTCQWVEAFNIKTGETEHFGNAECEFGYRESRFSLGRSTSTGEAEGGYVIVRAAFELSTTAKPDLTYKDLQGVEPTLLSIRDAVLSIRKNKFPDLSQEGTAGSFFKNPILPTEEAKILQEKYPDMPVFVMPETSGIKVPLAWLLDHVLKLKGVRVGRARLFEKQPLVVVAQRGCLASDVILLKEIVEKKVFDAFGFKIQSEVKIIL